MTILTDNQIVQFAYLAGFTGADLQTAVAIAIQESDGDTAARCYNTGTGCAPGGANDPSYNPSLGYDRGLVQFNSMSWSNFTDAQCDDPATAMRLMKQVHDSGSGFGPWNGDGVPGGTATRAINRAATAVANFSPQSIVFAGQLSDQQVAQVCILAGFSNSASSYRGAGLTWAIAVALATSGGVVEFLKILPDQSRQRGLFGLNDRTTAISDADAFNAIKNATAAFNISKNGSDFSIFPAFNSGLANDMYMRAHAVSDLPPNTGQPSATIGYNGAPPCYTQVVGPNPDGSFPGLIKLFPVPAYSGLITSGVTTVFITTEGDPPQYPFYDETNALAASGYISDGAGSFPPAPYIPPSGVVGNLRMAPNGGGVDAGGASDWNYGGVIGGTGGIGSRAYENITTIGFTEQGTQWQLSSVLNYRAPDVYNDWDGTGLYDAFRAQGLPFNSFQYEVLNDRRVTVLSTMMNLSGNYGYQFYNAFSSKSLVPVLPKDISIHFFRIPPNFASSYFTFPSYQKIQTYNQNGSITTSYITTQEGDFKWVANPDQFPLFYKFTYPVQPDVNPYGIDYIVDGVSNLRVPITFTEEEWNGYVSMVSASSMQLTPSPHYSGGSLLQRDMAFFGGFQLEVLVKYPDVKIYFPSAGPFGGQAGWNNNSGNLQQAQVTDNDHVFFLPRMQNTGTCPEDPMTIGSTKTASVVDQGSKTTVFR